MFENGSMVQITEGVQRGEIGYILSQPDISKGRYAYVVVTEEAGYGQWIQENQMIPVKMDEEKLQAICRKRSTYSEYYSYMPVNKDPYPYFTEMAEIAPWYNKENNIRNGFRVWVEAKEGNIPHCHVVFKGGHTAFVKLGKAEYLNGHESKTYRLNSKECRDLQKFFESTITVLGADGKETSTTIWLYSVSIWRAGIGSDRIRIKAFNEDIQQDDNGDYIMPNYSKGIDDPK